MKGKYWKTEGNEGMNYILQKITGECIPKKARVSLCIFVENLSFFFYHFAGYVCAGLIVRVLYSCDHSENSPCSSFSIFLLILLKSDGMPKGD